MTISVNRRILDLNFVYSNLAYLACVLLHLAASPALAECTDDFAALVKGEFTDLSHPKLAEFRRNNPGVGDPVDFYLRRLREIEDWKLAHPNNPDNFPSPESKIAVEKAISALKKVAKSKSDPHRADATTTIENLEKLRERKFPAWDTTVELQRASLIAGAKHISPRQMEDSVVQTIRLTRYLPAKVQEDVAEILESKGFAHLAEGASPKHSLEKNVTALNELRHQLLDRIEAHFREYPNEVTRISSDLANAEAAVSKLVSEPVNADLSQVEHNFRNTQILEAKQVAGKLRVLVAAAKSSTRLYRRKPSILESQAQAFGEVDPEFYRNANLGRSLVLAGRPQSVEGIAQGSLLGIPTAEWNHMSVWADNYRWISGRNLFDHDFQHAMNTGSSAVQKIPLRQRLEILNKIEAIKTPRLRKIIYQAIYLISHEGEPATTFVRESRHANTSVVSTFRAELDATITQEDAIQLRKWLVENFMPLLPSE